MIMNFSELYKKIENSVVLVSFGTLNQSGVMDSKSVGTGVVVLDGKHVLTCAHCTTQESNFYNFIIDTHSSTFKTGSLKFLDKNLDIALIEFQDVIGTPALVVDSNNMQIGNECFVVGYPNSLVQKTFLSAHIATINDKHLLLDCPVNHGNSGGPLFDVNGNVVGIVNAKHGGINSVLENSINNSLAKRNGGVFLSGVDPLMVFKEILENMKKNLNLGIGYAIKSSEIKRIIHQIY